MAYIVGLLSAEEQQELERLGWGVEPAPSQLVDAEARLGESPVDPERMKMVWVDNDMFKIMTGPDWEGSTPHVVLEGNLSEGYKIYGPYRDFDTAAVAHPGPDTWVASLEHTKAVPTKPARVLCKFCHGWALERLAHRHADEWVCDDCWDERLRSTS